MHVEVSGGLDSALIAASATRAAPERTRLVHLHHAVPRCADELECANRVAGHLAVPLEVLDGVAMTPFSDLTPPAISVPSLHLVNTALHRAMLARGPGHHLDGHGGDQLFFADSRVPLLVRAVLGQRGLRAACAEVAAHADRHRRAYLTTALASAVGPELRLQQLLRPGAPPWLTRTRDATLLGTVQRMRRTPRIGGKSRGAARVRTFELGTALATTPEPLRHGHVSHPLLDEEVIRAAISMPITAFLSEGRDRAVVRDQIAERIPPSIANRESKGDYTGVFSFGAARSFEPLAELLTGGWLAASGWIDSAGAVRGLEALALGQPDQLWPLARAIAIELWVAALPTGDTGVDLG